MKDVGSLLKSLYEATKDVFFTSESDCALSIVHQRDVDGVDKATVCQFFGWDEKVTEEVDFAKQFLDSLTGEGEQDDVGPRVQKAMADVVDATCFKAALGDGEFCYVFLGIYDSDWVGLRTIATET